MFDFSSPSNRTSKSKTTLLLTLLCVTGLMAHLMNCASVSAEVNEDTTKIMSLSSTKMGEGLELKISCSSPPTYTVYELFNPSRIIVDIAESSLAEDYTAQLSEETGVTATAKQVADVTPSLLRFEFTLPGTVPFEATQRGNDILIALTPEKLQTAAGSTLAPLELTEISVETNPTETRVLLKANNEVTEYNYDVLESTGNTPARMYIDLNNITGDTLLREQSIGTSLAKIRVAKRGTGLRIVFDSATKEIFPFTVQPVAGGLEVIIDEPNQTDQVATMISKKTAIEDQLPEVDPLDARLSPQATEKQIQDAFNFSGYNKERITVDFYKIDLHNVFRLFREVSGINIVVDQGVSGSLTLALDDVPWDFALDIILNLKNLTKEERFNTLVILPKDKSFNWAKQAENNLSFEANVEVAEQEALIIKQQKNLPKEVIEAKQLVSQAIKAEKNENYELAIRLYEQAYTKWPDNSNVANRIASIYLVRLGQNAKAVFYAKKSLAADPGNTAAALNAAIALANMQEKEKAVEYFDQSIASNSPSAEALLSYAAFSEGLKEYPSALKLIAKHDVLYGQNLNSMVSVARIHDKMENHAEALEKYEAILHSGFRIPPDLAKYIKGRIALKQTM